MLEKTKNKITLVCFLLAVLSAFCAVFSLTGKAFAEEPLAEPSVYAEDKKAVNRVFCACFISYIVCTGDGRCGD